ncbi:hypothetical protein LOC71_22340 [Rhodopirellula sp. JC740]|uniref:Tetratricopeptide repeat protein n=1 Tax=Rhodopirellula halodulae TaxID=2894198 RepID=A0ABS8NRD1_9BACT|nr:MULTISPECIES: hypothetical protein [unclassified Rhodopirellula]MCC9645026.1 hypothetical protein [Rhodopirellula sp. JC740]MCC9656415.1 hypothetical protein [Rhodopirellula sp. JC737]
MNEFQIGNRCFVTKDYETAVVHFLRHAKSRPSDAADAYASVAECYRRCNSLTEPEELLNGFTLVSKGDLKSAESYYRLALKHDPSNIKSIRGLVDILPEKSEERLALLESAVELQPGTLVLIDLGDFYRTHRKDYQRAYELYCKAQNHAPRDETAYRRLNDICRRLERPEEAKDWSERWKEAKKSKRNVGPNAG